MTSKHGTTTPTKGKAAARDDAAARIDVNNNVKTLTLSITNDNKTGKADANVKPGWTGPNPVSSHEHPFGAEVEGVSPTSVKQLKGSAAAFQPSKPAKPSSSKPTPMSMLNRGSVADEESNRPLIVQSSARPTSSRGKGKQRAVDQAPVGTVTGNVTPSSPEVRFSTDPCLNGPWLGTHYLKIDRVIGTQFEVSMRTLHHEFGWSHKIIGQKVLEAITSKKYITLYLCFDDLREVFEASVDVAMVNQDWNVAYCSSEEYDAISQKTTLGSKDDTTPYNGQVKLQAVFDGGDLAKIKTEGVGEKVHELAKTFGDVLAFREAPSPNSQALEFHVEYYKYSEAKEVISLITSAQPHALGNDWAVIASKMFAPAGAVFNVAPAGFNGLPETPTRSNANAIANAGNGGNFCSPTGRTVWSYDDAGNIIMQKPAVIVPKHQFPPGTPMRDRYHSAPMPITPAPFEESMTWPRSASYPHAGPSRGVFSSPSDGEPQVVKIAKIQNGHDVRTTIMLRNLPNRWTCQDMKNALDATSKGKYDFSYLRIDFEWNTNVGYAFVNFTDPVHIIEFVEHYVGNEWSPGGPGPRKYAAVSYATVQGYDCLVEKFRNSAIMDEFPGYRPKLWYTPETATDESLIGTEKPFPGPNNYTKKQRSHDNAGSIGLFAPRSGQRGGERRMRSSYDRGTPRQIQEDAAYYGYGHGPAGMPLNGQYQGDAVQPPIGAPPTFFPNPYYGFYPPAPMSYGDPAAFGMYGVGPSQVPPPPPMYPNVFGPYGAPHGAPHFNGYAHGGYGGHGGYGHGGYIPNNPASTLRTISGGRLAGRPRNVTVEPGNENFFASSSQQANIPRSLAVDNNAQESNGADNVAAPQGQAVDNQY